MHVNILACGIFGTVSGSSAATCATIAKVALPELIRRGYDEKTCLGSLCGAGTLGILLPPSIIMVVYAVAAEVSILKVFLAGFLPGFLLMALFSGYIIVWALLNPGKTPQGHRSVHVRGEAPPQPQPDPVPGADRVHHRGDGDRLGDGDRVGGVRRGRRARDRVVERRLEPRRRSGTA